MTAPLLAALSRQTPCALVTAPPGDACPRVAGLTTVVYSTSGTGLLPCLARWSGLPRRSPRAVTARLVNHLRYRALGLEPLPMAAWSRAAAAQIRAWRAGPFAGAPVWARGMPPDSFAAAIRAYRAAPFPLIVHYNDAMPRCLLHGQHQSPSNPAMDRLQHRQNRFLARHAQAFTFPCRRLAELMAAAAGFDRARCFVVPHIASPSPATTAAAEPGDGSVVYAGSAYPTVFTPELLAGIEACLRQSVGVRLVFILRRPDPALVARLTALTGMTVQTDFSPDETRRRLGAASALLVADAPHHAPLLLTKVAEAVALAKPVLAFTTPDSTTADVVRGLGGLVVQPETPQAVTEGFAALAQRLLKPRLLPRVAADTAVRVRERFSEPTLVRDVLAIADYAVARFAWQQTGESQEPAPPAVEHWP